SRACFGRFAAKRRAARRLAAQWSRVSHAKEPMMRASGSFEVTMNPLSPSVTDDPMLRRRSIAKVLHGALEATGAGEMRGAGTSLQGSGAYVAIERITGTLHGRAGSFVLLHTGVMTRGTPQLTVAIVPDSGTGELAGIAGSLAIRIADGR